MDQVAEVKQKTDIVAVISDYVALRKAGRNFKGRCPFHDEKSPSFMVSPEMQIYKCFGCGESGDVFTFLEKQEGMTFYESLQLLSKKAGVTLKGFDSKAAEKKNILRDINYWAARFYNYILLEHKEGKDALDYFQNKRKLEIETIKKFQLGYSPENKPSLFSYLKNKKGFNANDIVDAGICYRGRGGYVDRFRGRVIYPISDQQGNAIALAGRILPRLADRGLAKYINSPDTAIYNKSRSLFGLHETKQDIKKEGNAVIVEGEMDFLSSWQNGIKNVVAIKGTALTEEHVQIIARFTDKITLALDSDFAGDKAALKGISLAQNADLDIRVASMGKYKDPDEFALADPKKYKQAVTEAIDVWEFLIESLSERFDLSTGSGKGKASQMISPFLNRIDNKIVKNHYLQKLAQKLDVSLDSVSGQINSTNTSKPKTRPKQEENSDKSKSRQRILEEQVLILGIRYFPEKLVNSEIGEYLDIKVTNRVFSLLKKHLRLTNAFQVSEFVDTLPSEIQAQFQEMMLEFSDDPEDPLKEAEIAARELALLQVRRRIKQLLTDISDTTDKDMEVKKYQKKLHILTEKLHRLEENEKLSIIDSGE